MKKDTIFALATPTGKSAIAVIRISGTKALEILKKISQNKSIKNKIATLNNLFSKNGEIIDQSITTFFRSPKSYTGEDMVEISIHGGSAVIKKTISLLNNIDNCRIANPGEFTRRAFENNTVDLTQVDAIADLVNSETEAQRKQALKQLGGHLSLKTKNISKKIVKILANIEAVIDFSDEDLPKNIIKSSKEQIKNIIEEINLMIKGNDIGEKIRSGFIVAVIGKPNTGKSSFINFVAKRDIAIVTEEPGTTRDLIEVFVDFNGLPVRFYDTAGIRKSNNLAEKIGVKKAFDLTKISDVNLIFIDKIDDLDEFKNLKNKLFVQSKTDINKKIIYKGKILHFSSINGQGLEILINKILTIIGPNNYSNDITVSRERHKMHLKNTGKFLEKALNNKNIDLLAEDTRLSVKEITKITGNIDIEDILEIIFNDFCIGK